MLRPVLVTAPSQPPVSVYEARDHARVDSGHEDGLIAAYIDAATARLDGPDGLLGRALVTQTWRQDFDAFATKLRLPLAPVQSITSVAYYDADGAAQPLDAALYALRADSLGPYLEAAPDAAWPSTATRADAVSVTFVAGYGAPSAVPAPIRQAIRMMVAEWIDQRSPTIVGAPVASLPLDAERLVAQYRRIA